jgi:hypothetical protein
MWGGSLDASHTESRLEASFSPADLMKIIEPQITHRAWTVDLRGGDAVQAFTKFDPLWGGDSTALLVVTSLPGTAELSIVLNVYRNRGPN